MVYLQQASHKHRHRQMDRHTHTGMRACTHTQTHIYMYAHVHAHAHTHLCTHAHTHTLSHTYPHMQAHTHARTQACTHTHTHTHHIHTRNCNTPQASSWPGQDRPLTSLALVLFFGPSSLCFDPAVGISFWWPSGMLNNTHGLARPVYGLQHTQAVTSENIPCLQKQVSCESSGKYPQGAVSYTHLTLPTKVNV